MSIYDAKAWKRGLRILTANEQFVIAFPFTICCLAALLCRHQ